MFLRRDAGRLETWLRSLWRCFAGPATRRRRAALGPRPRWLGTELYTICSRFAICSFRPPGAVLRLLGNADHVPPGVKAALLRLSECQTKLFCTVPESPGARDRSRGVQDTGALDLDVHGLRLEPSNFLCELLAALRALEWPRVLVLVHGVVSPHPDGECPNLPPQVS